MELVVTGAGGFSGSHIVADLLAGGDTVTAVVGRSRDRLDALVSDHPRLTVVAGDLAGPLALPPRIDAIVHAAARSPAPGVTTADIARDNVMGTARLLDYAAAAGARTFIYLSSLSVYGAITSPVVDENTPIINPDAYGLTKYLGELMVRERPLRSMSIRLPGVIGKNSVRNWLTAILADAQAGRAITFYNPQAPFNNAIYVRDLSAFIARLLHDEAWRGHVAVTVGAAGQTTVKRAVEIVVEAIASPSRIAVSDAARPSFTISSATAQRFGYRPMEIEPMLRLFAEDNRH